MEYLENAASIRIDRLVNLIQEKKKYEEAERKKAQAEQAQASGRFPVKPKPIQS